MPVEPAWLQAGSTVVLVLVTAYYTYLLHRQNKRERRSYHTDTLRDRVREWYGHLPKVQQTDVESAEQGYTMAAEVEFRAAPSRLEGDNYFQDLLDNHGSELKQHKTRIENLYEQFEELEDEFVEEFDDDGPIESADLDLDTTKFYPEWVFDRILLLERADKTKSDLHKMTEQALDRNTEISKGKTRYPNRAGSSYSPILIRPRDDSIENDEEIVGDALQKVIDRLDEYEEYEIAAEAASLLDEIESEVNALEEKLVEYEGMATYPGNCEYIK